MMLIEWVGGWVSHALAFYVGGIVGLIAGCILSWYGETSREYDELSAWAHDERQGSTTPEGGHRADGP